MARASSIYIVVDHNCEPVAAFTVKHECITWLSEVPDSSSFYVYIMGDGGNLMKEYKTARDFVEGKKK